MTSKKVGAWLAVGVILLAYALASWRLNTESIWHDEAWSIRAIQSPFGTPDDNTPFVYYLTLHFLQKLGAGETPFALRYGSVLIHLLTVALAFRIAWRWYGKLAGITVGILFALSPLLWEYAQEVRAYVAIPLIALALLAGAEALLQDRAHIPRRVWIFLLLTEIIGLYTHNLVVPLVAWLNIVVILTWLWRIFRTRGFNPLRNLASWLGAQFVLFLLYIPWLTTQSQSGTTLNTVPHFNFDLLQNIWQSYFFPVAANDLPENLTLKITVLAFLTVLLILLAAWQKAGLKNGLVLSQAFLLPIFSTILLIQASIDFHPRYYVLGVPAVLLLLAMGIDAFPQKAKLGAAVIIIGLAGLISYQSLTLMRDNPRYQHNNFREMAAYYATLPADTLILIPYNDEPTLQVYFADQIQARFLPIPLHSTPDEAIAKINAALPENQPTRIELLTWYQVPADERGMYGCLLAGSSRAEVAYFETFGLSSRGYLLDRKISLQPLPLTAQFAGALQFDGASYTAAENGLCLQTDWQLAARAPDSRYSLAVRVLNPLGWDFAASDSLILRDDQARVKDWAVNDHGSGFALLQLPPGTPARDYDWVARLYSPHEPNGWDVLNERGQSLGKDLHPMPIALPAVLYEAPPSVPRLLRDNTRTGEIYSGQWLEVELENSFAQEKTLLLQGDGWQLEQKLPSQIGLVWSTFPIPDNVEGEARLLLDDLELATYTIIKTERNFTRPTIEIQFEAEFPGVGTLVGVNLPVRQLNRSEPVQIELIWQASTTPAIDYKVFVQILDPNGRLLAQSDAQPVQGQRPTSQWLADEYLLDSHLLHWNDLEYTGEATLIVGMYNPLNAQRILLAEGTEYATVPVEIMVRY